MYTIVFVDDEKFFLDKISSAFSWNEYGFELAAAFSRSENVMEYLEENSVDVLITDIKMPNVSGIELARECSQRIPNIIVVVLSAYQDFKYAQETIKYGVFEYLTKPLQYSKLTETLSRIKSTLDLRCKTRFLADSHDKQVLQQLFNDMLYGSVQSADTLVPIMSENNISIEPYESPCKIFTIHILDFANYINKTWKHPLDRLYTAVSSLIPYESIGCIALSFRFFLNYVEFFIISKEKNNKTFETYCDELILKLKADLKEVLNMECNINLLESYPSLLALIKEKEHINSDEVHFENEIIAKADEYIKAHYNESITLKDVAKSVNLSYKYFGNYFKAHTGFNFVSYLNLYRLKKAVEFMADSSLTITDICDRTGFGNQTFFYNLFRETYKMSPAHYRKKVLARRIGK